MRLGLWTECDPDPHPAELVSSVVTCKNSPEGETQEQRTQTGASQTTGNSVYQESKGTGFSTEDKKSRFIGDRNQLASGVYVCPGGVDGQAGW